MLQQAALPGPHQPLHTTSDLLRLLAADAHPFAAVAEAVAARFGGTAESQAWLARTLVTLLRDGLLYTEAEKMNAAYLLRFAAPGAAGSREALLHLALPDGGEPPAVRAWAATLAQPLPGEAPASGSSLGSIGSAGSSPAASPSWQQQQARTAGLAAAALLHQRTPRQVLTETAGLQDTRTPFGQQPLATPSPQLPWQATANLSAAAATPPPAMFDALPGSPSLAPSVPPWLQPQQPMSPPAVHRVASPLAAPAQLPPAASFSPHSLSPMPSHALPTALGQSPPPLSLQPLPPPLQPLAPEPAATLTYAAHQLQQQQQQRVPPQLLQQREQAELSALQDLLQQAAQASLVPAKQQQLVDALGGSLAPRLTAPLAAAVSGSSGGMPAALQPHHMRGLVEQNCPVASQLLLALLEHHPEAAAVYSAAVAEVPMSAQSVECLSAVIAGGGALPGWVLATFLANCMQDVSGCADAGRQSRHVKLLCACVALVLQRQPHALAESLPELLSFCIEQSRHKPAADLYRQLRGLEAAAG